jgi:methanogenic corrinoid protein MtbC1
MTQGAVLKTLDADGILRFHQLQSDAVSAVTERFYATHGSAYQRFGPRGRAACREDLAFHLEFLRPVLEFGLMEPMVEYLIWLDSVLAARAIPTEHLALSLDWLGEFFAEHLDEQDAQSVAAALRAVRVEFLDAGNKRNYAPQAPEAWTEANEFEAALLAGDQRQTLAIVNQCLDSGRTLIDIELHIIQPALYRIGEKWQANQVTVAQEHLATAIVQSVMTVGLLRSPPPIAIGKRALLACVEGNNHAVGLRMVSDAFQLAGWDVQYLGANVPTSALIGQVASWEPHLVGLSISFPQHLQVAKSVIDQLKLRFGNARPSVLIGGLAIKRFNRLADLIGTDAHGLDAREAVVCGNRLTTAQSSL